MIRVQGVTPRKLDQFFTKNAVAERCVGILTNELGIDISKIDLIIEPSCGDGAFVRALPKSVVYIDIDSTDETRRKDFLASLSDIVPDDYLFSSSKNCRTRTCLTIGNPPFGKNSSLAIAFFNQAARYSDIIAFIIPKTFEKVSTIDKLDSSFFLINQTAIDTHSFLLGGQTVDVPCVFQVWMCSRSVGLLNLASSVTAAVHGTRPKTVRLFNTADFDFAGSGEDADIAIRRVGVYAGRIFNTSVSMRNPSSHFFIRVRDRSKVETTLSRIASLDLEHLPEKYATAGMPSISKHELCDNYNKKTYNNYDYLFVENFLVGFVVSSTVIYLHFDHFAGIRVQYILECCKHLVADRTSIIGCRSNKYHWFPYQSRIGR